MSNFINIVIKQGFSKCRCFLNRLQSKSLTGLVTLRSNSYWTGQLRGLLVPQTKFITKAKLSTRPYEITTDVAKDVILYKYENPKFFKILCFFGVTQLVFWTYLSHFAFTTLRDAPIEQDPNKELAWYEGINLGENKYRNGITTFCFLIGYGILVVSWMFTLRSVRFLILRKGGREVSFVTYTPFGGNRIMNVPLNCVSAQESRETARSLLPVKVRNRSLFYVLDMRGEFRNPKLFDYTAGLKRGF